MSFLHSDFQINGDSAIEPLLVLCAAYAQPPLTLMNKGDGGIDSSFVDIDLLFSSSIISSCIFFFICANHPNKSIPITVYKSIAEEDKQLGIIINSY